MSIPFSTTFGTLPKQVIVRSLSNLWLFTGAKRINELGIGDTRSALVLSRLVEKSRIPEV